MSVRRGPPPRWVPLFNRLAKPLLALGVPMGPDVLLTVRGRKSGLPRTTPVTICEYGLRRGFISPFGVTQWVRNLRLPGALACGSGDAGRRCGRSSWDRMPLQASSGT